MKGNSKLQIDFRPKLLTALRTYSKEKFAGDLMAGIIVGIVALPLAIAFFLTVVFDLTIAIEIGLLLAMVLFMRRIAETTRVSVTTDHIDLSDEGEIRHEDEHLDVPRGVEVYEIDGPFFFGIANKFDECMKLVPGGGKPTIRIIRMRKVPFMDSTGLHNLESLCRLSHREGITVVLSGVNDNVRAMLVRSGMDARLGADNICSNIQEALARARALLEE